MKYYLIPSLLAEQLNLTEFRKGGENGYIVTAGDLAAFGLERAIASGSVEGSEKQAKEYINKLK